MITVAVLALNEEKLLGKTIDTLLQASSLAGNVPLDIIIINDGSTDTTPQIIHQLEVQYSFIRSIHHSVNKGPGAGVREAIALAQENKFIVVPGDNDLSLDLVAQLFLNRNKADLVLAYYVNMKERGWFRSCLSWAYTAIYRCTFNVPIHYINSACLYPTEKLRSLNIRSNHFGYAAEMTIKTLYLGCSFYQIPGLRKTEETLSRSISWKNLKDVTGVFLNLLYEVKISAHQYFKHRPVEII